MIRLLHTSDWHLGRYLHGYSLLESQKAMLQTMLELIDEYQIDALIVAGDIFDRSIPPAEAVTLLNTFISELAAKGCTAVLIPGNHDSSERLAFGAEFLKKGDVYLFTDPHTVDTPCRITKDQLTIDIYGVPFLAEREYGLDCDKSSIDHALAMIRKKMDNSVCNILTAHLFVAGGETAESERMPVGTLSQTDARLFECFDYTALGHLHRPQNISGTLVYSGSPLKYSFSESKDVKSCVYLEYEGGNLKTERIKLSPQRDLGVISGSVDDILHNPAYDSYSDFFLEVQLTDKTLIPRPAELISRRFPWLLSVRQKIDDPRQRGDELMYNQKATEKETFASFIEYVSGELPDGDTLELFDQLVQEGQRDET